MSEQGWELIPLIQHPALLRRVEKIRRRRIIEGKVLARDVRPGHDQAIVTTQIRTQV